MGAPSGAIQQWYPITGSTAAELRGQLDSVGPVDDAGVHRDGLTRWDIHWQLPGAGDRCAADAVVVTSSIRVTLPSWQAPADADPALVEHWRSFLVALTAHEQGHVDIVNAAMPAVRAALVAAGCAGMPEAGQREVERIRALHAAYDVATSHGRAMGAVLQ